MDGHGGGVMPDVGISALSSVAHLDCFGSDMFLADACFDHQRYVSWDDAELLEDVYVCEGDKANFDKYLGGCGDNFDAIEI